VEAGCTNIARLRRFGLRAGAPKRRPLRFLIDAREDGARVVGYGSPGKGTRLLNVCGIRDHLLDSGVDRDPYKHGRVTPGTHIPIHPAERIDETRPDS
jgi:hypothetical protein